MFSSASHALSYTSFALISLILRRVLFNSVLLHLVTLRPPITAFVPTIKFLINMFYFTLHVPSLVPHLPYLTPLLFTPYYFSCTPTLAPPITAFVPTIIYLIYMHSFAAHALSYTSFASPTIRVFFNSISFRLVALTPPITAFVRAITFPLYVVLRLISALLHTSSAAQPVIPTSAPPGSSFYAITPH